MGGSCIHTEAGRKATKRLLCLLGKKNAFFFSPIDDAPAAFDFTLQPCGNSVDRNCNVILVSRSVSWLDATPNSLAFSVRFIMYF
jgi:hypothetical protein